MAPRSVVVVGGGITGLATAFFLATGEAPPDEITLFESDTRLGGKLHTLETDDGWVEAGPDSFLAREPWVEDLCRAIGLGEDLEEPAVFGARVWIGGDLRPFPPGSLWGLPSSPLAALKAGALSPTGRLRALGDLVVPGPLRGPDISVAELVTRRFGSQVLDRLVDPLLAGTRAGSTREMSLAAALPQVDSLARGHRSIMRAQAGESASQGQGPPPFLGIRGGMQRLAKRLGAVLADRVRIHTGTSVECLREAGTAYEVMTGRGSTTADAVVVGVPAPAAADLLREIDPTSSRLLRDITYAPVASVALTYPPGSLVPAPGTSGVLVPSGEQAAISACTWWSTKWPGAAPGTQVVRCFVGRTVGDPISADDDELVAACARDVQAISGARTAPLRGIVTRWEPGLPQYRVGHLERLNDIERSLEAHPRIALAGAGYRGSGLPDCIRQAQIAAHKVMESTGPPEL